MYKHIPGSYQKRVVGNSLNSGLSSAGTILRQYDVGYKLSELNIKCLVKTCELKII